MVKRKKSALSNAKIAIVFFVFLIGIIGISLVFKIISVVMASRFDDSKKFTLTVASNKDLEVISLSPGFRSIAVFKLDKNIAASKAGQFLKIPIDGIITDNSLDLNQTIESLFWKTILRYRGLKTNLTIVDLVRLFLFARGIPQSAVSVMNIPPDSEKIDVNKIARLVRDDLVEKDKQTIKIINGTDIAGLGNRLARFITNMGGDVILVETSDSPIKKSSILYIDKKTYTVERLSKILGYEVIKSVESAISDITVIIGEDKANSTLF